MDQQRGTGPDVARADVCLVAVGEWSSVAADGQRALADAAIGAWDQVGWPEGLLSHWCLLGSDGSSVLHYIQAGSEYAARRFVSTGKAAWTRVAENAAPAFQRHGVMCYQVYRGRYFTTASDSPVCVVAVRRAFDSPGVPQARAWVDAMFAATGDADPLPGMIAAHMHVSVDGSRVLNLAQWTSAQAHQVLVDTAPQRITSNPELRRVESWPGMEHTTFHRYRPYRYIENPCPR